MQKIILFFFLFGISLTGFSQRAHFAMKSYITANQSDKAAIQLYDVASKARTERADYIRVKAGYDLENLDMNNFDEDDRIKIRATRKKLMKDKDAKYASLTSIVRDAVDAETKYLKSVGYEYGNSKVNNSTAGNKANRMRKGKTKVSGSASGVVTKAKPNSRTGMVKPEHNK